MFTIDVRRRKVARDVIVESLAKVVAKLRHSIVVPLSRVTRCRFHGLNNSSRLEILIRASRKGATLFQNLFFEFPVPETAISPGIHN
jgi:hypothetical protein